MDARQILTVLISFFLFGFSSKPYSYSHSFNLNFLTVQAEAGDPYAQFKLAAYYDARIGVRRITSKAKKWYRLAALNGHAQAQNNLGLIYQEQKNFIEAKMWFEQAANQKHPEGIANLASVYELGNGVLKNKQKAYDLYMQAAHLGNAQAMYKIGITVSSGHIGKRDIYQGCVWAYLAKRHYLTENSSTFNSQLRKNINVIVRKCRHTLTKSQMSSAQEEAVNWQPKKVNAVSW